MKRLLCWLRILSASLSHAQQSKGRAPSKDPNVPNGLSFNHNGIIPQGVKAVTFRLEPSETTRKLLIRKIIDRPYAALSLNGGGLTSYFLAVRAKPDCQRLPLLPA
jgi:hypothetical protein